MNNKIINIGIIGAGMVAEEHITKGINLLNNAKLTWVADINEASLAKFKDKFGVPDTTKDYRQMLADQSLDAVIICTPPRLHKQMLLDCIAAQKHTLVEKPAGISQADLEEMLQASLQHPGLIISDCSARHARLQPKFAFIKQIIDSGKLGEIYYIHHNCVTRQQRPGIEYNPTGKWFLNRKVAGGGPLLDWGVYDFSFHLGLLNDKPELISVKAFLKSGLDDVDPGTDVYDVEEHGVAMFEFTGGLKYYWERGVHANVEVPNETRIYGTRGGLRFAYCSWESVEVEFFDIEEDGKGKARKELLTVDMSKHTGDLYELDKAFVDAIANKGVAPMPLTLAKKHLEIIFKMYEAAGIQ